MNKLYKSGKKWHTHSFVAFFSHDKELKMAFIASKKVGNAVKRSHAKRRIRALCVTYEKKIKTGKYIFVAKNKIFKQSPKDLEKDFKYAIKNLNYLNK